MVEACATALGLKLGFTAFCGMNSSIITAGGQFTKGAQRNSILTQSPFLFEGRDYVHVLWKSCLRYGRDTPKRCARWRWKTSLSLLMRRANGFR